MGVREDDAIRALPRRLDAQDEMLASLKEDNKLIKEMLRAIKKSVVRKYGSGDDQTDGQS